MNGQRPWRGLFAEIKKELSPQVSTGWVMQSSSVPQGLHVLEVEDYVETQPDTWPWPVQPQPVVQRFSQPIHLKSAIPLVLATASIVAAGRGFLACRERRRLLRLAEAEAEGEAEVEAEAEAEVEVEAEAKTETAGKSEAKAGAETDAGAEMKKVAAKKAKAAAAMEQVEAKKAKADAKANKAQLKKAAKAKLKVIRMTKAEARAKNRADKRVEAKARAEANAWAVDKAKAEAEANAEAKAIGKAKAKAEAADIAKAKAKANAEAKAEAKANFELGKKTTAPKAKAKVKAANIAKAEAKAKLNAAKMTKVKANSREDAKAIAAEKAKAEAKITAKAKAKAEAEAKAKVEAEEKASAKEKVLSSRRPKSLKGAAQLWTSTNPAVTDVRRWFGGVVLKIDPDGNCFGSSWMVAALVWAVQHCDKIAGLAAVIETAREAGAFRDLDGNCQVHVFAFTDYVGKLRDCWKGDSAPDPAALAVGVVKTLLGSAAEGDVGGEGEGEREGENTWLSLKWGIVIVARALDVWCAGDGWEAQELDTLATFGESVDPLASVDPVALSRPGGAGSDHGGLQPGGGLGLVVGLVSEYIVVEDRERATEDFTALFLNGAMAQGDDVVEGVIILFRGAVHHYDVLVEAGTALEEALLEEFGLKAQPFDDDEGIRTLLDGVASQQVTLPHEILDIVGGEDGLAEQQAAWEAIARINAAQPQDSMAPQPDDEEVPVV